MEWVCRRLGFIFLGTALVRAKHKSYYNNRPIVYVIPPDWGLVPYLARIFAVC